MNQSAPGQTSWQELQRIMRRVRKKFHWIRYYARQLSPPRPVLEISIQKLFTELETVRDRIGQGPEDLDHLFLEEAKLYMEIAKYCSKRGNLCEMQYYEWEKESQ